MERILFSKKESAALLGISLRTLESLIARRELGTRLIGRRRLVPRVSLERLAQRDVPSSTAKVTTSAPKSLMLSGHDPERDGGQP
jgi:excisionase family DNA binding protein